MKRQIKFKKVLVILIISLSLKSCTKIECEAFDLSHSSMDWHLFPTADTDYEYMSKDSTSIILNQISYTLEGYEKRWCHMCACMTDFDVSYSDSEDTINIRCIVNYNSLNGPDPGRLYYGLNGFPINLKLSETNEFRTDLIYETDNYNFNRLDSIKLNNKTYYDLAEVYTLEKNEIDTIWIAKGVGLVGFDFNGTIMTKKE